jgi:hypothetical protein
MSTSMSSGPIITRESGDATGSLSLSFGFGTRKPVTDNGVKSGASARNPARSRMPAPGANSLCPGQEEHTMCGLEVQIAKSGLNAEPSRTEAVLILLFTFLVQIAEAFRTVGWLSRATGSFDNLDNSNYLALADFIRNWTPTTSFAYQHSWGYPYFIIAVSSIFHVTSLIRIVGNPSDAQAMGVKGTRTQDWF